METIQFDPRMFGDAAAAGTPAAQVYDPDPSSGGGAGGDGEPAGNTAGNASQPSAGLADELGVLLPRPQVITLTTGTRVRIRKLKTRELLSLLGIGLAGIGNQIGNLQLDPDDPAEVFMSRFLGLVVAALPHAQDEVMAFLRCVCDPDGKVAGLRISKEQRAVNRQLDEALDEELDNPEPDDTITILETVITENAGDLQTWGKRLAGIYRLANRTGQIPASPTSPGSSTSAR